MSKREQGFTLIELMIVVAIIAIIASIAIPNLLSARLNANESSAIATMKNIVSAQAQVQASGSIDENGNGAGEYGSFAELSGVTPVRGAGGNIRINPPVLSQAFGTLTPVTAAVNAVTRSGYHFAMYLPNAGATGINEDAQTTAGTGGGFGAGVVGPSNCESMWCCYAWPSAYGNTGKRTFFVNQGGDVLATAATVVRYDGATLTPAWDAAFATAANAAPSPAGVMNTPTATRPLTVGVDGNTWTVTN